MIVVITGNTSGIGKYIYECFVLGETCALGVSREKADLSVPDGWKKAKEYIHRAVGDKPIDVLINNAGIMPLPEKHNEEKLMYTHVYTPYMLSTELNIKNGGNIINIASVSGMRGDPDTPMYAATKAALINLTKSLAIRFAPKGIRVNSISPGFVDTNLVPGKTPDGLINTIPLKKEMRPSEIFPVVTMILESPNMTGSNIVIDGGLTAAS